MKGAFPNLSRDAWRTDGAFDFNMADDQDQDIFGENQQTSPQPVEDKLFGEDNTTEISLDSDKKEEESLPESRPVLVTESDPPTHEEKQEEPENTSSRTNVS